MPFSSTSHASVLERRVPVKRLKLADGETLVATVHDLLLANYGVDCGYGGGNVATNAIAAMGQIEASSGRISEIVGLIEEIAFQTNLLALNAAVESMWTSSMM